MTHEHVWCEQYKLNDNMELENDGEICEICGDERDELQTSNTITTTPNQQ